MTIADQSGSSNDLPNGSEAHAKETASAQHPVANKEVNTEMHQPDHAKAERAEPDQPGEAAPGDESPTLAESAPAVESAAPSEAAESTESASPAQADPTPEPAPVAGPEEPAKSTETSSAAEPEPAAEPAASSESAESTETAPPAQAEPTTESAPVAETEQPDEPEKSTEAAPASDASPATEPEPVADSAAPSEAAESTEPTPPAPAEPPTESAPPTEPEQPSEPEKSTEAAPSEESEPTAEPAAPNEAAESTETHAQAAPLTESALPTEPEQLGEPAKSTEPAPSTETNPVAGSAPAAEPAASSETAQSTEPAPPAESAPPTDPTTPTEPPAPDKAQTQKTGALLLLVGAFVVFAVLIAVGAVLTLNRPNSDTATEQPAQQTPAPQSETRVMATVDSTAAGLKGNLTTKWDGMVNYNFVMEPDDPARRAAFALTVSTPPRPESVRIQIKNVDGVVVCFQDIFLKFDPRKAAVISRLSLQTPGGKPLSPKALEELKSRQEDQIAHDEAAETEREQGRSMFKLNPGPDGKIASISSQGEIACPQSLYESMGYWSFSADLPTPQEQTDWLNLQSGAHPEANETPVSEVGAHEKTPLGNASQPGNFLMTGNDSIVSYDAGAGNIHTSTGKVFSIEKAGPTARVVAKLNLPAKIRYSCDQNSVCTITKSDGIVLHAHLSK